MDIIDAYTEHLRRTSRSGSRATPTSRRNILRQLDRDLPFGLAHTCQAELEDWLHNGRRRRVDSADDTPWSQGTKATYWAALRNFYAWASDPRDPWITEDPTTHMTPVHGVRGTARDITDEQLWTIIGQGPAWLLVPAKLAAYQGLRCIEISGLNREHVTAERLQVVRGKGGKARVHDTDPIVWEAVRDLPPGPVVCDTQGRRAGAAYISARASRHLQQDLGLEGVTLHRLRHWLGVRTQALYRDVRVTQEVLGHESLASTQIYTKATVEQQRAARAMLPRPHAAQAGSGGG